MLLVMVGWRRGSTRHGLDRSGYPRAAAASRALQAPHGAANAGAEGRRRDRDQGVMMMVSHFQRVTV
jgi:hypothetical protein